jgi:PAS domain-containing protein
VRLLEFLSAHYDTLAAVFSGLALLIPRVRLLLRKLLGYLTQAEKRAAEKRAAEEVRQTMLKMLESIESRLAENGGRLEVIEKEMKFNGGRTIKDMLVLFFNYRRHDYWRIGRPAMELDGKAQVTLVSEAACKLFGVVNPDDLKRRSWLRFVESSSVDPFVAAYQDTVKFRSEFTWLFSIHSPSGQYRGEWEMRASPITAEGAETSIYSAFLSPHPECSVAREFAKSIDWTS